MSTKTSGDLVPLEETAFVGQMPMATSLIKGFEYKPAKKLEVVPTQGATADKLAMTWKDSGASVVPTVVKASLFDNVTTIVQDKDILPEDASITLNTMRRGIAIGLYLSQLYMDAAGLTDLKRRISSEKLSTQESADFRAKQSTAGAIAAFAAASYVLWRLGSYREEDQAKATVQFRGVPDLHLTDPINGLKCFVFYLCGYLDSGQVQTPAEMLKMIVTYSEAYAQAIHDRAGSFTAADHYTSRDYRLVGQEFTLSGFELISRGTTASAVFRDVKFEDIVGNQEAKHKVRRVLRDLIAYDFDSQRNPMVEKFGCFQPVRMGAGKPGTGKTLLIAAAGTELKKRGDHLGLRVRLCPAPGNLIDSYQGRSGVRFLDWFKVFHDPNWLTYMPMDEAETYLPDRERQGVSSGQQEIVKGFLEGTEGAGTIIRGNAVVEVYTNIPDVLDPAVLSRISDRMEILGATTVEDVLDQNWLWFRKLGAVSPGFIDLNEYTKYKRMSAQRARASLSDIIEEQGALVAKDEFLRECVGLLEKECSKKDEFFYAKLFFKLRERYSFITSRDLRNIQRAVDVRLNDFDYPDEWYDERNAFVAKSYDEKAGMLGELVKGSLKGKSFSDVMYQETVKYYDTSIALIRRGELRRIDDMVKEHRLREAAQKKITSGTTEEP